MLVIKNNKITKIKGADIFTYSEEYNKYKRTCIGKKAKWATEEGFSLDFNTTLDILKKCIFVYPFNKETEIWIKKHYTIIEEC